MIVMSEQKKTNTIYYLCQFLGFAIMLSLSTMAFFLDPELQGPEFKDSIPGQLMRALLSYLAFFLLTHFLLRQYHSHNQSTEIKVYVKVIIQCSLSYAVIDQVLVVLFQLPKPDMFMYQHGLALEFSINFLLCIISFLFWSLLYLTITSIRDRRKLAEQLKDQQLASLMNQINPHFLFNSLNTIRGMIYEDEDKAAELVTQLSTLFRYNLSTNTKAYTSLGEELAVCQHYLAIEDIRLGDRLRLNINTSDESLKAKIPTMGLLTIVENAIKHGIANLREGGTLTLNSEIKDNVLIIEVINPYQQSLVKSGTKVGLKNLKQRIELIFGKQGTLSQKADNDIFNVNMSLPYDPFQNE